MMRRPGSRQFPAALRIVLLVSALALLALAAGAQPEGEGEVHGIFTDSVDVRLVNVDVVVTDAAGLPVEGLERDDFRLFEDGEEVEISHFAAVTEQGRRVGRPAGAGEPEGEPPPVHLVVLVDDAHLTATGRGAVLERLREDVDRWMIPGARVMVVHKVATPRIVQRFTADRRAVEEALAEVAASAGTGLGDRVSERALMRRLESADAPGSGAVGLSDADFGEVAADDLLAEIRRFAAEHRARVQRTAAELSHFVSALAGLPGRKAILYVADRLPLQGGGALLHTWRDRYAADYGGGLGFVGVEDELVEYDVAPLLDEVIAEASAARVMLYPLGDAEDVSRGRLSAASRGSGEVASAQGVADSPREGLWMLAAGTGGRAGTRLAEANRLFDTLRDDLTTYYSLGYAASGPAEGEVRRVEVEVDREGVEVRHLETYRERSEDLRMLDAVLTALLLGEGANPVGVEIELGEAEPAKEGLSVPVTVKFPMSELVLVPRGESHVGAVVLTLLVKDGEGNLSPPTRVRVPVEIDNREMLAAMTRTAGYRTELRLRPGRQTLAVGLRDEVGGARSVTDLTVDLEPPDRRSAR